MTTNPARPIRSSVFRVFFKDRTHADVEAATFGRDGADWVLYDGPDMEAAGVAARYPSAEVNGIALHETPAPR